MLVGSLALLLSQSVTRPRETHETRQRMTSLLLWLLLLLLLNQRNAFTLSMHSAALATRGAHLCPHLSVCQVGGDFHKLNTK